MCARDALLPRIEMCSDGSKQQSSSSWAVCVADDWLCEQHSSMPAEGTAALAARAGQASLMSGVVPESCSSGIFMAELQGVWRAIASAPVARAVLVHCDSQSVVNAIARYRREPSVRRRGRMVGRPLLELIARVWRAKEHARSSVPHDRTVPAVEVSWVRSHSSGIGGSLAEVGNRCADWAAQRAITTAAAQKAARTRPTPATDIFQLQLERGEEWLCVRERLGGGIVSGDLRAAAMAGLRRRARVLEWAGSPSQGTFAAHASECHALWCWTVKHLPQQCAFVLRLFADVLQYDGGPKEALVCVACGPPSARPGTAPVPDSAQHMLVCPRASRVAARSRMAHGMFHAAEVERPGASAALRDKLRVWLVNAARDRVGSVTVASLLGELGVPHGGVAQFGGFARAGFNAAMKEIGVPKDHRKWLANEWKRVLVCGWAELWSARSSGS
jgi:hypothetical protein